MHKRAIVLIPGFRQREQLESRDELVSAIEAYGEGFRIEISDAATDSGGVNAVDVVATPRNGSGAPVKLSVYEAYWGDLIPDWGDETPLSRFLRGTRMIGYWTFGELGKAVLLRLPTRFGATLMWMGLLLILWYVTVLAVLAQAFAGGGWTLPDWLNTGLEMVALDPAVVADGLHRIANWAPVVFLIGLLGIGRIEQVATMADFCKAYLVDARVKPGAIGLRAKTRSRVIRLLDHLQDGDFDDVHIVGHSIGGAMAVDSLAEYGTALSSITLHTWGTPLGLLAHQEPIIEAEIKKLYDSETQLVTWRDVSFKGDILGTDVPRPQGMESRFPPTVAPATPRGRFFNRKALHEDYYSAHEALEPLLRAPESGAAPGALDPAQP